MSTSPTPFPREITPVSLHAWLREGRDVQLLDVRSPAEYAVAHIAQAVSLPLAQLSLFSWIPDPERIIVCVCQSGLRGTQARDKLIAMGWRNVICLMEGMNGWTTAGLPVEKGEDAPWEMERQVRTAAGGLVVAGAALGWLVHPGFYAISALVGIGLTMSGITNWCGLARLLATAPWNRRRS